MLKRISWAIFVSSLVLFSSVSSASIFTNFSQLFANKPTPDTPNLVSSTNGKMSNEVTPVDLAPFNIDAEAKLFSDKAQNLNPQVVKLGLEAYLKARAEGLDPQQLLTIVDYSQPSTHPRLWVLDLKDQDVLFQELVAHGKNSGGNVPDSFSDDPRSLKSSLGLFVTEQPYVGHHGVSLRLDGLEKGFNDMAEARDIVVHAASYVNQAFAEEHGRLGRSWGCFAVNPAISTKLINTIKDGSLIFAYYPDRNWLSHSSFLH